MGLGAVLADTTRNIRFREASDQTPASTPLDSKGSGASHDHGALFEDKVRGEEEKEEGWRRGEEEGEREGRRGRGASCKPRMDTQHRASLLMNHHSSLPHAVSPSNALLVCDTMKHSCVC